MRGKGGGSCVRSNGIEVPIEELEASDSCHSDQHADETRGDNCAGLTVLCSRVRCEELGKL